MRKFIVAALALATVGIASPVHADDPVPPSPYPGVLILPGVQTVAPRARMSWEAPVVTFSNPTTRDTQSSTIVVTSSTEWNATAHTFDQPDGVQCVSNTVRVGNRLQGYRSVERGFKCTVRVLAPGEVLVVSVT